MNACMIAGERVHMRVNGGETVIRTLVNCGVSVVYGQPGIHVLDIYEALRKESRMRHVLAMHEVNAAFMADAQARLTGQPSVCLLTAGPGATNAVTGIAQAYTEASPVVQITGHCGVDEKIQPLHGVDDWDFLSKIYSPITKWSVQIKRVEDITPVLRKAFKVASSGRPGPVHVELPRDVQRSSVKFQNSENIASKMDYEIDEAAVKKIVDTLRSSNHPFIIVGKGVLREFCWEDVMKLAQVLGAPIVTVQDALSAIPYDFPLYVGYDLAWNTQPLIASLIEEADAVITFGLDVGERLMCPKARDRPLIHVHGDTVTQKHTELNLARVRIDVAASVKQSIKLILDMIPHERSAKRDIEDKVSEIKRKIKDDVSNSIKWGRKPIHPGEVGTQLRRVLSNDAILTLDLGDSSTWMHTCYRAREPNTVLAPGRYASTGFALPAAIAGKLTFPEREVVAVTGDGGFLASYMDFPTIVKNELAIKIIVMANAQYGTIWHHQRRRYRGHTFATEIQVPDFVEYAQSFGARGFNVTEPADLQKVLEEAVSTKGPVIVGVETDHKFPGYRPGRLARGIAGIVERFRGFR